MVSTEWSHDPDAVLDYTVDWAWDGSPWLADGETIVSSTWVVPTGLTQATPAPSVSGGQATVWISGGTAGQVYTVTNRITTSAGRTDDRSFALRVRHR